MSILRDTTIMGRCTNRNFVLIFFLYDEVILKFFLIADIDLTDPEVEAAATKIQTAFKGFKSRKQLP